MHDGNGFLIQHLKLTNIFEKVRSTGIKLFLALTCPVSLFLCVCQSVQSVDASAAIPYWDFTIDSAEVRATLDLSGRPILSHPILCCAVLSGAAGPLEAVRIVRVPRLGVRLHHAARELLPGIHLRPGRRRRGGHPGRKVTAPSHHHGAPPSPPFPSPVAGRG